MVTLAEEMFLIKWNQELHFEMQYGSNRQVLVASQRKCFPLNAIDRYDFFRIFMAYSDRLSRERILG